MELAAREPEPPSPAQARASGHLHGSTRPGPAYPTGPAQRAPARPRMPPRHDTTAAAGPASLDHRAGNARPRLEPQTAGTCPRRPRRTLRARPSGTQVCLHGPPGPKTHCCIRRPPRKANLVCGQIGTSATDSESGPLHADGPSSTHTINEPQLLSLACPGPDRTSGHIAITTCQPAGRHRAHQGHYEIQSRAQFPASALRGLPTRPRLPSLINCRSPTHTTQVRPLPTDREHRLRRGRTKTELAGRGTGTRRYPVTHCCRRSPRSADPATIPLRSPTATCATPEPPGVRRLGYDYDTRFKPNGQTGARAGTAQPRNIQVDSSLSPSSPISSPCNHGLIRHISPPGQVYTEGPRCFRSAFQRSL